MEQQPLNSFISYLRSERRYSELTIRAYGYDIDLFGYFLNCHRLPSERESIEDSEVAFDPTLVSSNDIKQYVMALNSNNYKATSVNRRISSLRSYFRYLTAHKIIETNPTTRISSLRREGRLPEFVERSKMERLIKEILEYEGDDSQYLRDSLIILLFFTLGMRLAELANIALEDFNSDMSELRIYGKGDKERVVPVLPIVVPYIKRYVENRSKAEIEDKKATQSCKSNKNYLFLTNKTGGISHSAIYRTVNRRLREVGVSGKSSPHVLRHTFATYMLEEGADLRTIQEILGHASLEATQIYTHNNISRLKEVYKNAHPRAKLKK